MFNLTLIFMANSNTIYYFDPIKPHFNIVKLGFTGVHIIFLTSAKKRIVATR